jgi:hypothetical protein
MMAVQSQSRVLNPTNDFLEALVGEFEGECRRALQLIEQLKKTNPDDELREDLEADLAVSLERFTWLAQDILQEWDRVVESLPE